MAGSKAWCDTCQKDTTRYARTGGCRSCQARENGLTTYVKHGNPGTPEGRRKGGLASMEKLGNPVHHATAEGLDRYYRGTKAGGYRRGRQQLGERIERNRAQIATLEAELERAR